MSVLAKLREYRGTQIKPTYQAEKPKEEKPKQTPQVPLKASAPKDSIVLMRAGEKEKLNIPSKRPLADFLPTIIIKAKDFATEITVYNTKEKGLNSESSIS